MFNILFNNENKLQLVGRVIVFSTIAISITKQIIFLLQFFYLEMNLNSYILKFNTAFELLQEVSLQINYIIHYTTGGRV